MTVSPFPMRCTTLFRSREEIVRKKSLHSLIFPLAPCNFFFAQNCCVQIEQTGSGQINRKKYRYHWRALDGNTRYRWDNARHHPNLSSFPHHVHVGAAEDVRETLPADLWRVLDQIEKEL